MKRPFLFYIRFGLTIVFISNIEKTHLNYSDLNTINLSTIKR
mgnify:CR=1 FL=1